MITPEEIARIDVLYGPFSAAFAGNSIGAVVEIESRMPDKLEGSLTGIGTLQDFSQYGNGRHVRRLPIPGDRRRPDWEVLVLLAERLADRKRQPTASLCDGDAAREPKRRGHGIDRGIR